MEKYWQGGCLCWGDPSVGKVGLNKFSGLLIKQESLVFLKLWEISDSSENRGWESWRSPLGEEHQQQLIVIIAQADSNLAWEGNIIQVKRVKRGKPCGGLFSVLNRWTRDSAAGFFVFFFFKKGLCPNPKIHCDASSLEFSATSHY